MSEVFEREVIAQLSKLEANQVNIKEAVDRSAVHLEKCVTQDMCIQTRQTMDRLFKKSNGNGSHCGSPKKIYWWALGIIATFCVSLLGLLFSHLD